MYDSQDQVQTKVVAECTGYMRINVKMLHMRVRARTHTQVNHQITEYSTKQSHLVVRSNLDTSL